MSEDKLLENGRRAMKKDHDKMVPVSVRLTPFQKEWLEVHEQLTGNKVSNVIRTLVDFYIQLDAEEGSK